MPPVDVTTPAPVNSAQSVTRGVKLSIIEVELRKEDTRKSNNGSAAYWPVQVEAHEEKFDLIELNSQYKNCSCLKKVHIQDKELW